MKTILLAAMIVCSLMSYAFAQKKTTVLGNAVIGEVVATSDAAREITIKYVGTEGPEIFVGILVEGYRVKMEDGNLRELRVSEITPGIRVRVFYKTNQEDVSGLEKKVHRIFRIDFLGGDEYARLREQLNMDPSTPVARAENEGLPAMSPLKVYLAIAYVHVQETLVDWMDKWNRKQGNKYGKLELVSNLAQADISVVVSRGSDNMVGTFPTEIYYAGTVIKGEWSQATSYLVIKDDHGLKVLWVKVAPVLGTEKTEVSIQSTQSIENEIEKRMKGRMRSLKK